MKLDVYKDENEEWRWRVIADNGKIVGHSGEGYKKKKACLQGFGILYCAEYVPVVKTVFTEEGFALDLVTGDVKKIK